MKNLLEFILIHLVTNPEDVAVDEDVQGDNVTYTIHVNPEDIGRVIGKGGSVIHAIRKIAQVRAVKENIYAEITIAEE